MTTNPIDPKVTKTSHDIAQKIEEDTKKDETPQISEIGEIGESSKVQKIQKVPKRPKPIKPTGRERGTPVTANNSNERVHIKNINNMEDEAISDDFLAEDTIKAIKGLANQNPVTRKMIEDAKQFTSENREEVYKQCTDIVALYNISHKKPFFFISPAEARLAIDYVKKCREGYVADLEDEQLRDELIFKYMDTIVPTLERNYDNVPNVFDVSLRNDMQTDIDKICGLEMGELHGTITTKKIRQMYQEYDVVNAFRASIGKYEEYGDIKEYEGDKEEEEQLPQFYSYDTTVKHNKGCGHHSLSLNLINQIFSVIENNNITVDVILMNSFRIADMRSFGNSICKEYDKKEFLRRRVFGQLFTAEIYPCNELADNQVVFGSIIPSKPENKGIFLNVLMDNTEEVKTEVGYDRLETKFSPEVSYK